MSRCVILSAGPVQDAYTLRPLLRRDDVFIAADGGRHLAERLDVIPQICIGDFDSGSKEGLPAETQTVVLPTQKDETDTAAACRIGLEMGLRDFLLLGCTGGRLDHQQAALTTAVGLARQGCKVELADNRNRIRVFVSSPGTVSPLPGYKLSFFAFGGPVMGLTLKNTAYPLTDYDLSPFDPLCVSNEFLSEPAEVTFRSGILLLYLSKD